MPRDEGRPAGAGTSRETTALGKRLAEARGQKGWSLRDAERKTGIHNAHIVQIETGKIDRPEPSLLYGFAEAYGLDFQELLRLAGHIRPGTNRQVASTALRAIGRLTPREQTDVFRQIARFEERRRPRGER